MVGIRQNHFRFTGVQLIGGDGFDVRQRPHGHKPRRVYITMRRVKRASPSSRFTTLSLKLKFKRLD